MFTTVGLQVDKVVVNKYWGLGAPDYSCLSSSRPAFISETAERLLITAVCFFSF
jgi:hypothetical protein